MYLESVRSIRWIRSRAIRYTHPFTVGFAGQFRLQLEYLAGTYNFLPSGSVRTAVTSGTRAIASSQLSSVTLSVFLPSVHSNRSPVTLRSEAVGSWRPDDVSFITIFVVLSDVAVFCASLNDFKSVT